MIENNADRALLEEREGKAVGLSDSTRRFLVGQLADYVISVYGLLSVTPFQLAQFSKSAAILFPSLHVDETNSVSNQNQSINYENQKRLLN